MSLKKNISGGVLDVPLLDREVADGEVVEVPDFQPAHDPESKPGDPGYLPIVWPDNRWADADPPKPAKGAAKADDASGKAAG